MSISTVVIRDFVNTSRIVTILDEDDFEIVDLAWRDTDKILVDLLENPFFEGKKRWCDLDPKHFLLMIQRTLFRVGNLNDQDRTDSNHKVVKSLHFLLCGIIRCIESRTNSTVEIVKVNRVSENDATIEYSATIDFSVLTKFSEKEEDLNSSVDHGIFTLIVDNE